MALLDQVIEDINSQVISRYKGKYGGNWDPTGQEADEIRGTTRFIIETFLDYPLPEVTEVKKEGMPDTINY